MGLLNLTRISVGEVGIKPGSIKMITTDSLATITTAGYLNGVGNQLQGLDIAPSDVIECIYSYNSITDAGTLAFFQPTISNGLITLNLWENPGNVLLPVISGNIAVFNGTSGQIMSNPLATPADATNYGGLFAGASGVAGTLRSYPATATTGYLALVAVANSGNFAGVITNAALGQASTWTLADPAGAASKILQAAGSLVSGNLVKASGTAGLMVDAGARIIANTTATYAGGGTSNTFAATGLTVGAKGSAVIRASTNSVSITKALPGTDTLAITFSADPGANTTVDYIYSTASQA